MSWSAPRAGVRETKLSFDFLSWLWRKTLDKIWDCAIWSISGLFWKRLALVAWVVLPLVSPVVGSIIWIDKLTSPAVAAETAKQNFLQIWSFNFPLTVTEYWVQDIDLSLLEWQDPIRVVEVFKLWLTANEQWLINLGKDHINLKWIDPKNLEKAKIEESIIEWSLRHPEWKNIMAKLFAEFARSYVNSWRVDDIKQWISFTRRAERIAERHKPNKQFAPYAWALQVRANWYYIASELPEYAEKKAEFRQKSKETYQLAYEAYQEYLKQPWVQLTDTLRQNLADVTLALANLTDAEALAYAEEQRKVDPEFGLYTGERDLPEDVSDRDFAKFRAKQRKLEQFQEIRRKALALYQESISHLPDATKNPWAYKWAWQLAVYLWWNPDLWKQARDQHFQPLQQALQSPNVKLPKWENKQEWQKMIARELEKINVRLANVVRWVDDLNSVNVYVFLDEKWDANVYVNPIIEGRQDEKWPMFILKKWAKKSEFPKLLKMFAKTDRLTLGWVENIKITDISS